MSPRTKEQNEEIRKLRTREILEAAVRVYAEKGYAASEIGDIAERAGLARGLVYYYFKDKQNLFHELYDYMMDRSDRFAEELLEGDGPVLGLVANYAKTLCGSVLEEPAIPRFYMRVGLDLPYLYVSERMTPFEWMTNFIRPLTRAIEKGIGQGVIPAGDAGLLAGQFWGALSEGMNYLDHMRQRLGEQGMAEAELKERLRPLLDQAVRTSLALLRGE